jgi:N-acetylneuraminic acid mutarotase
MVSKVIYCVVFALFSLSVVRVDSQICYGISQYDQCSMNGACGCFHMIGAHGTGICGFLWVTCSELVSCGSSNNVCDNPDHICVSHPRCHSLPVCYPVSMIDQRLCPPIEVTNSTITSTTTVTSTTATITTTQNRRWLNTASMNITRSSHTASVLTNGKVLVTGGSNGFSALNDTELYDPSTDSWTIIGNLNDARESHTASILTNGKVLVTGGALSTDGNIYSGTTLESTELYDPSTNSWTTTGNLNNARTDHTASVLSDGKVLVTGGAVVTRGSYGNALNSAELYDPSTGNWRTTGNLMNARQWHTASVLTNGKVLVTGGWNYMNRLNLNSAELYDPSTGSWTTTGNLNNARQGHTASVLTNGKVLVIGGYGDNYLKSAEIYDPSTGSWTITGNLTNARSHHTASVLTNGKVLVTGGESTMGYIVQTAELYDPSTGSWTTAYLNNARKGHTASVLTDGKVLVIGGYNRGYLNSAEIY